MKTLRLSEAGLSKLVKKIMEQEGYQITDADRERHKKYANMPPEEILKLARPGSVNYGKTPEELRQRKGGLFGGGVDGPDPDKLAENLKVEDIDFQELFRGLAYLSQRDRQTYAKYFRHAVPKWEAKNIR